MEPAEQISALQAENAALRQELALLREQLAAALARIAEHENRPKDPPSFVKPNTPKRQCLPRKKRQPEHNRARCLEPPLVSSSMPLSAALTVTSVSTAAPLPVDAR